MDNKIDFTFVGDIFPANLPLTNGYGIANEFEKHKGNKWIDSIKNITENSDFVFGNLEAPLIYDSEYSAKTDFAGSWQFADFLKKCGFNILSITKNS